jgi:hypothetical protein
MTPRERREIPLHTDVRLFQRLFQRITSRGYRSPPWDGLDPSLVPEEELVFARETWAARMNAEYRAMAVFAELSARAAELGLPVEIPATMSRLVQDEARHVELCAELSSRLGGPSVVSLAPRDLVFSNRALPPHLDFASLAVCTFCIGEASSVALLRISTGGGTDACVDAVLETLLRDEILHDRFGWALAGLVIGRLTEDEREWLGAELARSFDFYERLHADRVRCDGAACLPEPGPLGPNLGVLPEETHARAFYERVERVILPRLDALGAPAHEASALRREA